MPKLLKKISFFSPCIRMSGKSVNFGEKKYQKSKFYQNYKVFKIYDMLIKY